MSSVPDDLSQWRAYGGGEGGVAIGFNPPKIVQGDMSTRGYLVPVRYSEQDHKAMASDVAIGTLKFFREGLEQLRGWACRTRTGESVGVLSDWIYVTTWSEVGASPAAETLACELRDTDFAASAKISADDRTDAILHSTSVVNGA
jgi:hypothetical protein